MTRIVLAYPDTAWGQDPHRLAPDPLGFDEAIAWLGEQHHGAEVIALMLDFGQGANWRRFATGRSAAGAVRAHVIDVADAFTARFLLPALRAGALYLDGRPSMPALGAHGDRPAARRGRRDRTNVAGGRMAIPPPIAA